MFSETLRRAASAAEPHFTPTKPAASGDAVASPPGLTHLLRQPRIRRFRGLLECAFSVSLCHYAGQFKKAAALFFSAAVRLFLLRLLAACPGGERRRGKNESGLLLKTATALAAAGADARVE